MIGKTVESARLNLTASSQPCIHQSETDTHHRTPSRVIPRQAQIREFVLLARRKSSRENTLPVP